MGTVLVIDDEHDVRLLCRLNLAPAGIDVRQAASGESGLASAYEEPPDAVVLDLMMPEMDGFEVLRRLRLDRRTSEVPVLVLTARSSAVDRERCAELGATSYMTKPFDPEDLHQRLETLMGTPADAPEANRCARCGSMELVGNAVHDGTAWTHQLQCRACRHVLESISYLSQAGWSAR